MVAVCAAFLLAYAVLAAWRVLHPASVLTIDGTRERPGLRAVLLTCVALTWLNPHVYLDTVVLLGSVAATYGQNRWYFGAGAILGSACWFTGLGVGSGLLRPLFARPRAWQLLDGAVAVVMATLAVSLVT